MDARGGVWQDDGMSLNLSSHLLCLPTQKTCCGCGRTLPLAQFHRQAASPDGHNRRCKACVRASVKGTVPRPARTVTVQVNVAPEMASLIEQAARVCEGTPSALIAAALERARPWLERQTHERPLPADWHTALSLFPLD